jgi:hypothetical protein
MDPKSGTWPGILDALSAFTGAGERCREKLNPALTKGYKAAIKQFGIPVGPLTKQQDLGDAIGQAKKLYSTVAKKHRRLILKALTATTSTARKAVVRQLKKYVETEKVAFFVDEGRKDQSAHSGWAGLSTSSNAFQGTCASPDG